MDPTGFQIALGDSPAEKVGTPLDALVDLWNEEMTRQLAQSLLSALSQV